MWIYIYVYTHTYICVYIHRGVHISIYIYIYKKHTEKTAVGTHLSCGRADENCCSPNSKHTFFVIEPDDRRKQHKII